MLPLLKGAQTLSIHDHEACAWLVWILNELGPNPQTLRTGIDGGPHLEPTILVQEHSVEYVRFPSAVLAHHGDDSHMMVLAH